MKYTKIQKERAERRMAIYQHWLETQNAQKTGKHFGITRARVHQVIAKAKGDTVRREDRNDS